MPSSIESEATKYKAYLKSTLKDGKLTQAEANSIVADAKKDGTEVKALYLAGFVEANGDKFDPAVRNTLESFLTGASLQKTTPVESDIAPTTTTATGEPTLAKGDGKGITYTKASGSLTVNGFGSDDGVQGGLGDCYFISSMMAVANTHPEILQKAIKDNGNGTYTVTFWQRDNADSAPRPVKVTVDDKIPEAKGAPQYVGSRSGKEIWPEILEKAYAQWHGGYEDIQGGMGANALSALTGARPGFFPVNEEMKTDDVWSQLKSACSSGGCVVADSTGFGHEKVAGVVSDHTYTVLGVEEKNGQRMVKLRNPWGEQEPGHDGTDDGIFELPVEQFVKSYAMVEYVKP